MTTFEIHTIASAPDHSKGAMEAAERKFGFLPNLIGVLAESPAAVEGYVTLTGILDKSSLEPAERQLLLLTISAANGCHYCVAAHTMGARAAGLDEAVIEAVRDGNPIPDGRLTALNAFSLTLNEKRGWASDEDVAAFLGAGYTKAQVLNVVLAAALKTLSNYTNHLAGTPLDGALEPARWRIPEAA